MEEQVCLSKQLKIIRKLGNGCQGEVFQAHNTNTMQRYALKVIKIAKLAKEKERRRLQFEIQSNLLLSSNSLNSYFPKLYHYWFQEQSISFLFQLCQQNSESGFKRLNTYSQRYNYLIVLLFDALKSLSVLEQLSIIHRDIKPENILRKQDCFKMADLGLSRVGKGGNTLTNNIGNKLGRSPEFITGNYSTKSDIWSLGIHIFYLLQNTLPFDNKSLIKIRNNPNDIDKIISSDQLQIDFHPFGRRSKNVLTFIHLILTNMIIINPDSRWAASYLLKEHFASSSQDIVRLCLLNYLKQRNILGRYYLMVLLAYYEFHKATSKIRDDSQNINKVKICMKVRKNIFSLLSYLQHNMLLSNPSLSTFICNILYTWEPECRSQKCNLFKTIDEALQIYQIAKVKQKFPLVEWIVKLYKTEQMQINGVEYKKTLLWDIPIDLYKLL